MKITLDQYLALEDEAMQERYSNGHCWMLAYALNEISGWPIMVVAEINLTGIGWVHMLNQRPDGMFVDILGEHTLDEVWDDWDDLLDDDIDVHDIIEILRDDFQERSYEDPKKIGPDTYVVANHIYHTLNNTEE